jgi:hypothetical protein
MESIVGLALLFALASWLYKSGKRDGSRGGFNAGRRSRR